MVVLLGQYSLSVSVWFVLGFTKITHAASHCTATSSTVPENQTVSFWTFSGCFTAGTMARCRGFLLPFGLLALIIVIQVFSYRWDVSQENRAERIHQLQKLRRKLIQEQCHEDKKTFLDGKHGLNDISDEEFDNFIVDDNHGIIYCYIPKVACTNWKRVLFVLNQTEPYPDPVSIDPDSVHLPNKFTLLSSFSRTEIKGKLKQYTKFLFVRDPFVRLISAYRDKFLHNNSYFYVTFGREILRLYDSLPDPPQNEGEAFDLGIHPSFHSFIQYLVDPWTEKNVPFEPHWRQMYRLCQPCLIDYDFIGHQETLQDDAKELLKMLKLEDDIKFPPVYDNVTSPDSVVDWFRTVPLKDRRKLYKLYEQDFRLFGYRRPSELLNP